MSEISKPDFTYLWSSGGALVAPSNVKIQTGWTAEVPPFQWENWSQNRQDQAIVHILQKGISVWSSTGEYYFTSSGERSYVQGSDGKVYVAVADSVGQNPTTDLTDTYWSLAFADVANTYTKAEVDNKTTIATTAQAQAWSDNTALITPLRLAEAFKGGNQSFTTNGYQKLPGGFIIQWGQGTITSSTSEVVTFPIAFPSTGISGSVTHGTTGAPSAMGIQSLTSTGMTVRAPVSGTYSFLYLVVGI